MEEIKCKYCGKKLGEIERIAEIKCPRCKKTNKFNTVEAQEAQGD
jgi:phage FluMu protein Com